MGHNLTIADLPETFGRTYGDQLFKNRPFYVSHGQHERQGPYLFRSCPDRLVPIGERVAWAMLRQGRMYSTGLPVRFPTYLESLRKGHQPDPYQLADAVSL